MMTWSHFIQDLYDEFSRYLSQEEKEQLVDDLTIMVYKDKDKKKNEDML